MLSDKDYKEMNEEYEKEKEELKEKEKWKRKWDNWASDVDAVIKEKQNANR